MNAVLLTGWHLVGNIVLVTGKEMGEEED